MSYKGYTEPAIDTCKSIITQAPIVLCTLEEFVMLLEKENNLVEFLREKVRAMTIDKQPFARVS